MKYTMAYCFALGRSVTAEEAYSAYWQGIIGSNAKFECASEGCAAEMRCINIDRLPNIRKREPHFRVHPSIEAHDKENCGYHPQNVTREIEYVQSDGLYVNRVKQDDDDVVFVEEAPPPPPRKSPSSSLPTDFEVRRRTGEGRSGKQRSPNLTRIMRLRELVSRFIRLSRKELDGRHVRIGGTRRAFSELFFDLNERDNELPSRTRHVFHGRGYVDEYENSGYRFKFHFPQIIGNLSGSPSCFIPRYLVDKFDERHLFNKVMQECIATEGHKIDLYIYGTPSVYTSAQGRQTININTESLDHIYFFPRDYNKEGL